MFGRITLVGAGELMPAMSRLHRGVLAAISNPHPVFLDTTAGFETNCDAIVAKAVEYYKHHLQTELRVASYRHREVGAAQAGASVAEIRAANLIFAGPGSPTYAITHWRDTPVWQAVIDSFESGADLLFASAASIATGHYAMPVYEIYKAGADPYWVDGLDLLGEFGLKLAIVPHFDDTSGGENYDSRYCYMGARRFDALQKLLPDDVTIIGIDAYTAICFDAGAQTATVSGKGRITLIGRGEHRHLRTGETLTFADLRAVPRDFLKTDRSVVAPEAAGPAAALREMIEGLSIPETERVELLARLKALDETTGDSDAAPLVDLVVELRESLRASHQFETADRARDALSLLGYEVEDTAAGSSWSRRDA